MKRLLVTGVSGLLGLNLAWLSADRFEVTGVMRGERAVPGLSRSFFNTVLADLAQPGEVDRVLDAVQPDMVIHCAALTNVDLCEMKPDEAQRINAWLPGELAKSAKQSGVQFLHISTDAVFDGQIGNYKEEDSPKAINVYAQTKLAGEHAVAAANPDALIARVNFFGWSWQGRRSLAEFFFYNLLEGTPVLGFSDIYFSPLLVNDMVEVLLEMLERNLSGLYHVVSREGQSKYEFARMLACKFGFDENQVSPSSFTAAGLKAPRSPRLTLCSDKLARALGKEMPSQEEAMQRYADLYRQGYPEQIRSLFVQPDHSRAG